jgi:hypothetical protein
MSSDKRWFITDRAIDDPERDAFAHDDVAGQLVAIVESITPPATIGLLGGFGTGKTSIGNLLCKRLAGHTQLQVVTLSAEKHSETARQRALVFSFAEALREDAGVDDKKIATVLGRVEESEDVEGPELDTLPLIQFAKDNKTALRNAAAVGVLFASMFYVAGFICSMVLRAAGMTNENPLALPIESAYLAVPLVTGLFGALMVLLSGWGKGALTPRRKSRTRPRAEAADELERIFADLVRLVKKRLVVVVDDIDRLAPNEVLEALATIKTLQAVPKDHPPIFIISCDDAIVRRAIQEAEPGISSVDGSGRIAADEYLNKLFVVRQPLPPHLKEDMQEFALTLLTSPEVNHAGPDAMGDSLRGVLEILIHDGVADPRHVIRLINAFFADYRLAKVREVSGGRLGAGEVTENPLMLARLTVLRVDFAKYYEAIRDEFELLRALDLHVVGGQLDESQRRLLQDAAFVGDDEEDADSDEDTAGLPISLADFLRRTARYVEREVPLAPFFYLGQTAAGRVLGSQRAETIRRALENNDIEAVRLQLTDEASIANAAVDHIKATINRARPGLPLTNAVATSAAVLSDAPESRRNELANEVATLVAREPESVPPPAGLTEIIRRADPVHHHDLINRLVRFEDDTELARARADALLPLVAERPSEPALVKGLDEYFSRLADNTGWNEVRVWLPRAREIEPAIRSKIIGVPFFTAVVYAAVGAPDDGIDVDDVDLLGTLLDEAEPSVRMSRAVAEAVRACGTAAGKEPRWLAVRVLAHLAPVDDDLEDLLLMLAQIVTSDDVGAYQATLTRAMNVLSKWATSRQQALETLPSESVAAVITAVAAVVASDTGETGETVQAGAGAAATVGVVWPSFIQPAVSAMAVALDEHRDLEDATGRSIQQALLSIIPKVDNDTLVTISDALFAPLETAGEGTPATWMAVESVGPAASTMPGREMIASLVPGWRTRFNAAFANANEPRPQIMALGIAADHGALPDDEEQALLERLQALPPQAGVMPEVAAVALATIRWQPQRRLGATETIASVWVQLGDAVRSEILGRIAGWPPAAEELDPGFSEFAASHALEHEDDDTKAAWIDSLWPAFQSADRARVLAEGIASITSLRDKMATLEIDDLLEALRRADPIHTILPLVDAAQACPESVRSEAAHRFILGSFDDAEYGWNDEKVRAAVNLLDPVSAKETVEVAVRNLSAGATDAGRAASLLGWIREAHSEAVKGADDAITAAIRELLPQASPDLAGRLGAASKGIPWGAVNGTVKEMRKRREEQAPREAADAFESGRGGR